MRIYMNWYKIAQFQSRVSLIAQAHADFDILWRFYEMDRSEAYYWLSEELGVPFDKCHMGQLTNEQLHRVISLSREKRKHLKSRQSILAKLRHEFQYQIKRVSGNFGVSVSDLYNLLENRLGVVRYKLKEDISERMIKAAENLIPDLGKHVLVKDVSTPLTYERYTGATEGGWYDIDCSPEQAILGRVRNKTPVDGLYLTGAKTFPGSGMFGAIQAGLFTADSIL